MNSTVLTAMAAALGSLLGAAASIATTWITQRTQTIRAHSEWKLRERESLYKEFIREASRLAVDALVHSLEQPDQLMVLYGILSCIRLMSGEEVVRHDPRQGKVVGGGNAIGEVEARGAAGLEEQPLHPGGVARQRVSPEPGCYLFLSFQEFELARGS